MAPEQSNLRRALNHMKRNVVLAEAEVARASSSALGEDFFTGGLVAGSADEETGRSAAGVLQSLSLGTDEELAVQRMKEACGP